MRLVLRSSIALLLAGLASGCTSDDYVRSEGVTTAAGEAQAANTVMQMVDPWKYGVQNTRLLVPAKRGDAGAATPDQAAGAKAAQTTTGN
ncbi:hypothetical protein EN794_044020 [Mesorhizobium sp. M00.F.Ca.ET.151.01.1.1]|uniref:hypothetical protein n=1 Tax=unclassified Mesorhizobium TaxID=325217 RepID=UPI000FCCC7EB|nr:MULTISPECIES: hypothetical protein [unclassified Mesorhizobium]RUW96363.1 hypothetical protein EOA35_27910 [Mesorhizobium sp. M8A.F.Ca.ET.023.01.1.1]TGR38942.1 hypothetical protein EN842_43275 [bacterium M00.F.Ca.ET.199.01.1.1]TGU27554.1 hypothetical protein EN799_41210 [bacterium M00.F.Ca.ET.156.01.1.1]TGU89753.1 hypothetical protein EN794_044020 [Mesorhizobium sp. M00.F.Ca.ET.151.01.1.1]TGV16494.1 hypothetical protein EN816_04505 [Mesorhizobium sp. M8A.F.Ca.ET.173.01.1.1]TGV61381.1 hypot